MRVLIIGGTGLISVGIVKHLLARGADLTVFNRGQRPSSLPTDVRSLVGDRNEFDVFERRFAGERFDVVIDMICFTPTQALSAVRAFGGRCTHFLFCSTVCTYGVKVPASGVVDESFPQEPISQYGRDKLACERIILDAHRSGAFMATVVRPSHTYGPGNPLIDQLEFNACSWDRIAKGLPVLLADGGLALWNSTHRDDCGKFFAHASLNSRTYGKSYNATIQRVFTWRDYYKEVAEVLGTPARLLSLPADTIVSKDPKRFQLLAEITRHHGAYTSAAAIADVPEFKCEIDFKTGVKATFDDLRRRNAWRDGADSTYQSLVDDAMSSGQKSVDA
jgi:nucleoside-diphosphate-sugar epimerase